MNRRLNIPIWVGLALALVAAFSYIPVFSHLPATRDFPWVNLLLFAVAVAMLALGLHRAFHEPEHYRGKISGSIAAAATLAMLGIFCFGVFYYAKQLPPAIAAVQVGQTAPGFSLARTDGKIVSLSEILGRNRAALLIFYRGYW